MYYILYVLIGISYINIGNSYVLLQLNKQDDRPNGDTLIHKAPLSDRVNKIGKKFASRRQFSQTNDRAEYGNNLDNVLLAIDTGAAKEDPIKITKNNAVDIIDKIVKAVSSFVSSQPAFRSGEYTRPETVNLGANKPSVMFEINSKSIIKALKDILSSKSVAKYVDKITKEAAVVYRSVQDESKKN